MNSRLIITIELILMTLLCCCSRGSGPAAEYSKAEPMADNSEAWALEILTDESRIDEGEYLFISNCAACHSISKKLVGPALEGIHERAPSIDWIVNFVQNSQAVIESGDEYAISQFEEYYRIPMPANPSLTRDQILNILGYIMVEADREEVPAAAGEYTLDEEMYSLEEIDDYRELVFSTSDAIDNGYLVPLNDNMESNIIDSVKLIDNEREIIFKDGRYYLPKTLKACIESPDAPNNINDLTVGLSYESYSFEKGDGIKVGLLGFVNIEIDRKEKVVIAEYMQVGNQICNNWILPYGIGARMKMHISNIKRNAKLNTPEEITASVLLDQAEVVYAIKTFGITGPGTIELIESGSLEKDTYSHFDQAIRDLIGKVYENDSLFTIDPQPLYLKQDY